MRRHHYAIYYAVSFRQQHFKQMFLMSYVTCHKHRHVQTLDLRAATAGRLRWRTGVVPGERK